MTEIREIIFTQRQRELWPLMQMHRDELATRKDLMVLNPDLDVYRALEKNGKMVTLGLFDEYRIVGYSIILVMKNLHYSDLIQGFGDVIFIHPAYRKGFAGIRLIKQSMEVAKKRGAKIFFFHGKPDTKFSALMSRLGFFIQDQVYGKEC